MYNWAKLLTITGPLISISLKNKSGYCYLSCFASRITFRWRWWSTVILLAIARFCSQMRRHVSLYGRPFCSLSRGSTDLVVNFKKFLLFVVFISIHLVLYNGLHETVFHVEFRRIPGVWHFSSCAGVMYVSRLQRLRTISHNPDKSRQNTDRKYDPRDR